MSFDKILANLKENENILKMEILPTDPTARTKAGMVNQARQEIERLKQDFRDEALKRSVFILVFGSRADKAAKILKENFGVLNGSPSLLTAQIIEKLDAGLYNNKQLHPSVIDLSSTVLDGLATELGIDFVPPFYYDGHKHAVMLKSREDLDKVLTTVILEKVGGEIFAVNAIMANLKTMIEEEYSQPVIPMVMEIDGEMAAKMKTDLQRINKNVFTMNVGGADQAADLKMTAKQKLDKNVIEKALIQIKQNLK